MKPTIKLIKGKIYYYTASTEWVKVKYMHETINGYMFSVGKTENMLTTQDVNQYIEEI